MQTFLIIVHILVTIGLIALILIQKSEGGGLVQSSSGSGLMSTRSTANLLTRTTAVFATLFMGLCLLEAIVAKHGSKPAALVEVSQTVTAPKAPEPTPKK